MSHPKCAHEGSRVACARQFHPRRPSPLYVPESSLRGRLVLQDDDRDRGVAIHAGSGSGKSVYLGRVLCFQDFLKGVPQIVLDPHGPLIDNFLLALALRPLDERLELWRRVIYVDMSGRGVQPVPFPLLYRLPGESCADAADRFLETLRKIDPQLKAASIQGWNALVSIGRPVLMLLAALELPVTDAGDLLRHPERWETRLREAALRLPEVEPAVAQIQAEYLPLRHAERLALARSFLVKLAPFGLDPALRYMFATTEPGIDLAKVVADRSIVLLDFRNETNVERRRFKTRWVYEWTLAFVKFRGAGKHTPLGFVVDELTELTNQSSLGIDLFATDLDELINVYARNYSVQLALAHQEMFQLSPDTMKTMLTLGTQIFGVTADKDAGKYVAEQFFPLDPYRVKRYENVWGGGMLGPQILEQRVVDMPIEEQMLLAAQDLMGLQPFQFLVKTKGSRSLTRISARRFVEGVWTSDYEQALAYIRHQLSLRVGVPRVISVVPPKVLPTADDQFDTMEVELYAADEPATYLAEQLDDEDWTTPPLG